ncbi:hypothetical protein IG631_09596 [Alternaria alternata]|nr:hypothetical protein IG631_09596 [Alternaria alternata]
MAAAWKGGGLDGGGPLSSRSRGSASSRGPSSHDAAVVTSTHFRSTTHVSSSFAAARIRRVLTRIQSSLLRVNNRNNESQDNLPFQSSRRDAILARTVSFTDTSTSKTVIENHYAFCLIEMGFPPRDRWPWSHTIVVIAVQLEFLSQLHAVKLAFSSRNTSLLSDRARL